MNGKRADEFATKEQGEKAAAALSMAQAVKEEWEDSVKIVGFNITEDGYLMMTYLGSFEENISRAYKLRCKRPSGAAGTNCKHLRRGNRPANFGY